jgi:hypothetical protein
VCGLAFVPKRQGQRFDKRECQLKARHRAPASGREVIHVVIPDTQVRRGVPLDHLRWVGKYIAERAAKRPGALLRIIHLGDHFDMPSLSSYDKGKKAMEGRRYIADIQAGIYGFDLLHKECDGVPADRIFLAGNHENRIVRAIETDPQVDGLMSVDDWAEPLRARGWAVHDFLVPVVLEGVTYAHYFYNPMTGRPYSGENTKLRLKNIGRSFTMGHQQTFDHAIRYAGVQQQHGLILGACYLHDEDYKGPQGNAHWRGIAVCFNVRDGAYDPMFVSLDSLCQRYEGVPLAAFTPRLFA